VILSWSRRIVLKGGAALIGSGALARHAGAAEPRFGAALGPDFAPDYAAPAYDSSGRGIPADAIDASEFPNLRAWFDALARERRPGRIGSGLYDGNGVGRRRLVSSLFGYGETRPVIRAEQPCILYFGANDIAVQYLRFETRHLALAYVDRGERLIVRNDWRSADLEGQERDGTRALEHDADISGIRILDCEFFAVLPVVFMSQYHEVSDIVFARNRAGEGCAGFFCLWSDRFRNIRIYQNIADGLVPGDLRGNHVGTVFWVGSARDNSPNFPHNSDVFIENNRIENVTASRAERDYNSGVAIDVREAANAVIRNNIIRNVVNTAGHVDSNAIYAKSNLLLEGNHIENCGAAAGGRSNGEAGSEGSLITLKGGSRCRSTIRNNRLVAGTRTDVPMVLVSHMAELSGNSFEGWQYSGDHMYRDAMIRSYSGGPVLVAGATFVDCGTAPGNSHRGYAASGTIQDGGNMRVRGLNASFDGARTDIFLGDVDIADSRNTRGRALEIGVDEEAGRILARAGEGAGRRQKIATNALIRDLRYHAIWERLHLLAVFHSDSEGIARVNWLNPLRAVHAFDAVQFQPLDGYRLSSGGMIEISHDSAASHLAAEDCMIAIGFEKSTEGRLICGSSGLNITVDGARAEAVVAADARLQFPQHELEGGLAAVQRASAGAVEFFHEGKTLGTAVSPVSGLPEEALRIALEGTASSAIMRVLVAGRSLAAGQHDALHRALGRYRAATRA